MNNFSQGIDLDIKKTDTRNILPASYIIYNDGAKIKAVNESGVIDYSSVDAATVVQNAVNNGYLVHMKAGTYKWTKNVNIPQGVIFQGEGEQQTILNLTFNPNFNGITCTGGVKWTILRNFGLYGNAPASPGSSVDGIVISGSQVELNNLYIRYVARHGINANNFTHLRIINIYSSFNRIGAGAYIHRDAIQNDSANQILIEGGNYLSNNTWGIQLEHVTNALLNLINADNNDDANIYGDGGIYIKGGTRITINNFYSESQPNGIIMRTGTIGIGTGLKANGIRIVNSIFNSSNRYDIDGKGISGLLISQCYGTSINLDSTVDNLTYENSNFTTENISASYLDIPHRWIQPYNTGIALSNQVAIAGKVYLLLFEINQPTIANGIVIQNAGIIAGSVTVGIYGPIITEETCTGTPVKIQSVSTILTGINSPQIITFNPTKLNSGRYYMAVEYSDNIHTYISLPNTKQVEGWVQYYDRSGGYGSLIGPCPSVIGTGPNPPGLRLRCNPLI